jgi:hypothetical protein
MIARLPAACLLFLAVLAATSCGGGSEAVAPPPETVTVTVTESAPPPPPPDDSIESGAKTLPETSASTTYQGEYFSLDYPIAWEMEAAEVSKGSYLDTTIRDPADSDVMLRVDVSPAASSEPANAAAEVEAYLRRQPGYRRLRYQSTSFLGYDAFRWDFLVEEGGVLLRKSDIFFTSEAGDGVAVLIQAPAARYRSLATTLEAARRTLTVVGEERSTGGSVAPTRNSEDFCATHTCIDNFDEGDGYPVQCADGQWSQSGGIQGACSHHGGVLGGSGTSGSYGDIDDNGDGSTYNWCGASRDGDGDGLWCEGR